MVGGGSRKDEPLVINSTNVFAALGSLRKKKKASTSDSKSKSSSSSSSRRRQQQQEKLPLEEEQPPVFWAPAPLNAKSWADVEDEDDDDFYATTAPPQSVWAGATTAEDSKAKEISNPFEGSESEEEGLDDVDDDNEEEHENEPEPETPVKKEPVLEKPAEVIAPKESEKQLSKKELKKKELEELEAMLAEFGFSKSETQDNSNGGAQDKKVDASSEEVDKKENTAPGESKSAKKKKKKEKSSKEAKEHQDQPNGIKIGNATDEIVGTEKTEEVPAADIKDKIKKVTAAKKKKSSKERDAAAKAVASEAAARNAKLAAAKKKEKNHYNQQPMR